MITVPSMATETARALLALSRERTARLRARRDLRQDLRAMGWRDSEHAELIECHERVQARDFAGAAA